MHQPYLHVEPTGTCILLRGHDEVTTIGRGAEADIRLCGVRPWEQTVSAELS